MGETLPPIIIEIETPASPDEAWAALTEPGRVAEWFTEATPLGRIGDPYRLDFGDDSAVEGTIRALDPGRQFAFGWAWTDAPAAPPSGETLVTWSVDALADGGSRIRLVHDGWADAGTDASIRTDHEGYWTGYLDDLAAILAEGG